MKTVQTKQTTPRRFRRISVVLAAVLVASVALGSCTKSESKSTRVAAKGTIRSVASVQKSIEIDTKAPNDATSAAGLQVYAYVWNVWGGSIPANQVAAGTMTFRAGAAEADAVGFDTGFTGTNLLPTDRSCVYLQVAYPASGWTANSGHLDYHFSGCEDVMVSKPSGIALTGGVDHNDHPVPDYASLEMRHCLTRFEITVRAENTGTQALWGKIKSIEFKKAAAATFDDGWWTMLNELSEGDSHKINNITQWPTYQITAPLTYTDDKFAYTSFADMFPLSTTATPVCYTMMAPFKPTAGTTAVILEITTLEKDGGREAKTEVPLDIDPATLPSGSAGSTKGVAFAVNLTLKGQEIVPTATIIPWNSTASGSSDIGGPPPTPAPMYYGGLNGGVTTGLQGSTTSSYNSLTIGSNGPGYGSAEAAYAGEKPYYKLEVAPTDEKNPADGSQYIPWDVAMNLCKSKTADGGGWRLPRLSEVRLIYLNKVSLEATPGFTEFPAEYYFMWAGTEPTGNVNMAWNVDFASGNESFTSWHDASNVRCVRELPPPAPAQMYYGDVAQNGGVTTNLQGSTTSSYNSLTIGSNGTKYGSEPAACAGEKGYYKLEVALENEPDATWEPAYNSCKSKTTNGGGWRLPRFSELKLMYLNKVSLEATPGFTALSSYFWSGTEYSNFSDTAWYMDFSYGSAGGSYKSSPTSVRCVRELPAPPLSLPPSALLYGDVAQNGGVTTDLQGSTTSSYNSLTINNNGTLYGAEAEVYANEKPYYKLEVALTDEPNATWENAYNSCKSKTTDGGGWRLPRLSEMKLMYLNKSSLDATSGFTAILPTSGYFWSGTETSTDSSAACCVAFSYGGAFDSFKFNALSVRCVREI